MTRKVVIVLALTGVLLAVPVAATSSRAVSSERSERNQARIAFASFAIDQQPSRGFGPTIFTVNPDGSGGQPVGRGGWPEWSPNGRMLTFQDASRTLWDIAVTSVSGADRRPVARHGIAPHWSPDGKKIVFWRQSPRSAGIYVVGVRGGGPPRLVSRFGAFPTWSPDGARILYSGNPPSMPGGLYTMRPDGTDQRLVRRGYYSFAEWSPDGSRIAALASGYVYILNANGTGQRRLPPKVYGKNLDCSLAWSPDGRKIAFTPHRNGGVYLISVKTGRGHVIPGTDDACGVSWAR